MVILGLVSGNSGLKGEEGVAPSSKAGWESGFWQFHASDDQHIYCNTTYIQTTRNMEY